MTAEVIPLRPAVPAGRPTVPVLASAPVMLKARRLLADGAVEVRFADADGPTFTVRGDHATYDVLRRRGGWSCSCPCRHRCSHLTAVALISGGLR